MYMSRQFRQLAINASRVRPKVSNVPATRSLWSFNWNKPTESTVSASNSIDVTSINAPSPPPSSSASIQQASEVSSPLPIESIKDSPIDLTMVPDELLDNIVIIPEMGWGPHYKIMTIIEYLHTATGIPYWEAIVIFTIALRLLLLPVFIASQQGAARLAVVRPLMQKIQDDFVNNPKKDTDPSLQSKYQKDMQALFKVHKVNPMFSVMTAFIQLPIFISVFFGIKDFGTYFPDYAKGGAYWFTDLSAPDSTMVLPMMNAACILSVFEYLGLQGVAESQKGMLKAIARFGIIILVPYATSAISQGLLLHWVTNGSIMFAQSVLIKQPVVRKYFDIPDLPASEAMPPLRLFAPEKFKKVAADAVSTMKSEFVPSKTPIVLDDFPPIPSHVPPPPPDLNPANTASNTSNSNGNGSSSSVSKASIASGSVKLYDQPPKARKNN